MQILDRAPKLTAALTALSCSAILYKTWVDTEDVVAVHRAIRESPIEFLETGRVKRKDLSSITRIHPRYFQVALQNASQAELRGLTYRSCTFPQGLGEKVAVLKPEGLFSLRAGLSGVQLMHLFDTSFGSLGLRADRVVFGKLNLQGYSDQPHAIIFYSSTLDLGSL